MKIKFLVKGDTTICYSLRDGKTVLNALKNTNLIIDQDMDQAVDDLNTLQEDGNYVVVPHVSGG